MGIAMKATIEHNLINRKFKNLIECDVNATNPMWVSEMIFSRKLQEYNSLKKDARYL